MNDKTLESLKKIKTSLTEFFGSEVKMVDVTLATGGHLAVEPNVEPGAAAQEITAEGNVALDDGVYELEDGRLLTIAEDKITEVKENLEPIEATIEELKTVVQASGQEVEKRVMVELKAEIEKREAFEVELSATKTELTETKELVKTVLSLLDDIKAMPADSPTAKPKAAAMELTSEEKAEQKMRFIQENKKNFKN